MSSSVDQAWMPRVQVVLCPQPSEASSCIYFPKCPVRSQDGETPPPSLRAPGPLAARLP